MQVASGRTELSGFEVVARPWATFGGPEPAARRQLELWGRGFGPRAPSRRCRALLAPEGRAREQWRGVQPRPERVEVQRLRRAFLSYMGQAFDGERLYSEVLLKVAHLAGAGAPPLGAGPRNLSSLLFPLEPREHARRHGLPESAGRALEGLLFRELALFRGRAAAELELRFPWARVFPPGRPLVPLLESSLLNYGHWVSRGLARVAALWGPAGADPSATFLVYEAPFVLDAMQYLLGADFERRVSRYDPRVLYFADEVLTVGPEYFDHVDNLARETAAAVRGLLLPPRDPPGLLRPATAVAAPEPELPSLLLLSRSDAPTRGRAWSNFNEGWRLASRLFGSTHIVRPYICGDYTFHGQLADFAAADIVVGIDGACFGNVLWMRPGGTILTIVPSKRNYIPIMPVRECGYTYAWKFADAANVSAIALMLPEFDADSPVEVPMDVLERALLAVRESRTAPRGQSGPAEAAILPGPTATAANVMEAYPIDLVYDAVEKHQLRIRPSSEDERRRHRRGLALHRRYQEALKSAGPRGALLASLRRRCAAAPGCQEDQMAYWGRLLEHEQRLAVLPREHSLELLAVRRGLLRLRPGNALYLFQLAEQLEALGARDGDTALLREALGAFEGALRADAAVGVLDDLARYKAWEMLVLLHQSAGDPAGAELWLQRARASGYPWRTALQLPFQRMFHPRFAAKPFWECGDAAHLGQLCALLEAHHAPIRAELSAALRGGGAGLVSFTESTGLVARGNWTQVKLAGDDPATRRLVWRPEMCRRGGPFERTCGVLRGSAHASAITGTAKFYLLAPGSVLKPHCGQANLRLFMQLGVVVPPGVTLSVGGVQREWQEGKVLILDDSFVHSVTHTGTAMRATLSIPVWHPDVYHRFKR